MPSPEIQCGKLKLTSPIMNAAGPWAATQEQLQALADTSIGAVVTKSFTLQPSVGNSEPHQHFGSTYSINSVGLKNWGADYFIHAAAEIKTSKPLIASLAESSMRHWLELVQRINHSSFAAIELNLSCPNVQGKESIAYDATNLEQLLKAVMPVAQLPVGLKLPPYSMRSLVQAVSAIVVDFPINHLVLINTYPLATGFVDGQPSIKPNDGIGGLSGPALKPIALAQVKLFHQACPSLPIIGVGGVTNTQDVEDFISAGATAIQVGTAIHQHGIEWLNQLDHRQAQVDNRSPMP